MHLNKVAGGVVLTCLLTAGLARAQTYEFKGCVDTSHSNFFHVGDAIDFTVELKSPLHDIREPSWPTSLFMYESNSSSLVIGGIDYNAGREPISLFVNFEPAFNQYGLAESFGGFVLPHLYGFQIDLYSFGLPITTPDGILIGGIPLTSISLAGGYIFDDSFDYAGDPMAGLATWKMTEYTVAGGVPSAVPEASTYGLFGAFALCGLAAWRRYSKSS